MTRRRGGLLALGVFAAGTLAGIAAEELFYRRAFRADDPESNERFGSLRGEPFEATSFDGTVLSAESYGPGDAPACVLLHGFTLTRDVWHYQVRDLAATGRIRVIVYDARGHGRSGAARGPGGTPFTGQTLARDLRAVLDASGATRAVVCGHSMGGMTTLAFCEEFPAELGRRVAGLVLLNTTFTAALGAWREDRVRFEAVRKSLGGLTRWLADEPARMQRLRMTANDLTMWATRIGFGSRPSPAHVAFTRRMIDATRSETLGAAMVGLESYETLQVLPKIDVPVLVVGGEKDLLTPSWLSREMAERIPGAHLVILPGTGHMGMLERHAELSGRLEEFCEATLGAR